MTADKVTFRVRKIPHISEWEKDAKPLPSPLLNSDGSAEYFSAHLQFVTPGAIVLGNIIFDENSREDIESRAFYILAGPRREIWFKPKTVKAAIVTCGGLCPGLNNVVREIVFTLYQNYGVEKVYGIQYGYRGFWDPQYQPVRLDPERCQQIHHEGGTTLGSSRGGMDRNAIMDCIIEKGYNQIYIIGGDGTHRGAQIIHEEIKRRGLYVSIAGIPKTIDNDIRLIDRSFGFDTAVEEASRAITCAHVEAMGCPSGVSIVKLMGRSAGFIAMYASLASRDVTLCLIPEVHFRLEPLLAFILRRVKNGLHTTIVVAEGAGQGLCDGTGLKDASGNLRLADIATFLQDRLRAALKQNMMEASVKLIDPTYQVRSLPANSADSVYCSQLAQGAVHGVMAGFTGFTTGMLSNRAVYLPFEDICGSPQQVDPSGAMWQRLLIATGQPDLD
mmetsp:Transcript_46560/g.76000  ORF Transcript_46560/g.76000 Transcript_46560/m.76000 type:complete len:445 (-) Transcript_46560:179-1513(-)|eukprot:CAMPEP_0184643532 /NCGR_PEP_ID=MMETSP0308-20130426/384_1 /TAXON_ID=38269 /ORGANISM="Gloeochaete witrockiana, Strain SAG 46.84" /LENGTH=444 /DNA_ID=CAMNT_0027071531 /DNA_START=56 /DNA_END=1390 /DNA_ORIENTATION=-